MRLIAVFLMLFSLGSSLWLMILSAGPSSSPGSFTGFIRDTLGVGVGLVICLLLAIVSFILFGLDRDRRARRMAQRKIVSDDLPSYEMMFVRFLMRLFKR